MFIAFLLLPLATVVVFSFNDSPFYAFPLEGFTISWYAELFRDPRFITGLRNSVEIASVTALAATALGTTFAYSITRQRYRLRSAAVALGFLPLVTPALILGVTFQAAFVLSGIPLSRTAVIIAHTTYTMPLVALVVATRFLTMGADVTAAARDLGATPAQAVRYVTLPLAKTAVQGGLVVALLLSFNEFIIAFHTSSGFFTLPQLIYSMQRVGLRPTLLAYFSLVILAVVAGLLVLERLIRKALADMERRRREG